MCAIWCKNPQGRIPGSRPRVKEGCKIRAALARSLGKLPDTNPSKKPVVQISSPSGCSPWPLPPNDEHVIATVDMTAFKYNYCLHAISILSPDSDSSLQKLHTPLQCPCYFRIKKFASNRCHQSSVNSTPRTVTLPASNQCHPMKRFFLLHLLDQSNNIHCVGGDGEGIQALKRELR